MVKVANILFVNCFSVELINFFSSILIFDVRWICQFQFANYGSILTFWKLCFQTILILYCVVILTQCFFFLYKLCCFLLTFVDFLIELFIFYNFYLCLCRFIIYFYIIAILYCVRILTSVRMTIWFPFKNSFGFENWFLGFISLADLCR